MAAFTALTEQQQAATKHTAQLVREALLSARNTVRLMRNATLDSDLAGGAALADLDSGEAVPNSSSLDGAQDVLASDVAAQVATMKQLLAVWDTADMRALHAKFVGARNIDGLI